MGAIASSVVAALLLDDGRTTHTIFQIPIPTDQDSTCKVLMESPLADDFMQTVLIMCDEMIMSHRYNSEAVDRTLCDIIRCNLPFWCEKSAIYQ